MELAFSLCFLQGTEQRNVMLSGSNVGNVEQKRVKTGRFMRDLGSK